MQYMVFPKNNVRIDPGVKVSISVDTLSTKSIANLTFSIKTNRTIPVRGVFARGGHVFHFHANKCKSILLNITRGKR